MGTRTVVVVLAAAILIVVTIHALHGRAHGFMRRWMPAIHGGH
jgi:hypothetical protein